MKSVAIVIPCRNEERYISLCLDSILKQDYPGGIEVFVCDGRSTDSTREIVNEISLKNSNIHLIDNEKRTTPFALNNGINRSSSDVVIILGAHSELYPDYVSNCVSAFEKDNKIGCTGGVIENVYENKASENIGIAMSSGFGVGNAHFRTGSKEGYVDTVAFGAYKRSIFEITGLFDEELARNQDDEFNYRLIKSGFKIYLSQKIRSRYYVRGSYKKLYSQYFQYGYWKVYVNKKHKAITTVRQLVPAMLVLYIFGGLLTSIICQDIFPFYLTGLSVYILMAAINAFRKSKSRVQVPGILFSYFILHYSYGLGYLKGILEFLIFGKKVKNDEILTR